ncbi:MAG: ATP-binding protein [Proteobacteria bacterium]|nr:ATP-binding protein [Pseudomonadota bacterium]
MPTLVAKIYRGLPILALGMAVLLLVAGIGLATRNENTYTDQKVRELEVQARIMASSVDAALVFDDAETAGEYVAALSANPELRAAAVYRSDGRRFASFARAKAVELPETMPDQVATLTRNTMTVRAVVAQDELQVGTVYLVASREMLADRVLRYGGVGLLVGMGSLVVTVLAVAQRALAGTNRALRVTAAELTDANRKPRLQIEGREKAEAALRQAQKMETIGQLTGGVAHDFNNLLTIILGNLQRVLARLRRGDPPERIRENAENAIKGAERAAAPTQRLLAFSRRQPLDPRPVDVNKLVAGMSELLHRTLGEQVVIETVVAGGLWRAPVDPNQLENAILNLAVNARDAMTGGGKLTIETANAYLDTVYAADQAEVEPGQYVAVCISDTGCGMTKEVIRQAFEPFFTTKDVGHGTGLGLSQVYGFVKQSGGHVKIYGEPGEGTTIKTYLPRLLHDDERPAAEPPPEAPADPARSTTRSWWWRTSQWCAPTRSRA